MTNSSAAPQDTISVGESVSLIPMVPHLLGFAPQESLVVLCFRGKRLGPVMRVDLPVPDEAADVSEYLAVQAMQHGNRVALIAYSGRPDTGSVLQVLLDRMLVELSVIDAIVVQGNTASFLPDPQGTVQRPVQLPVAPPVVDRLAAESALRGRAVLPNRQAVVDSIAGPTGDELLAGGTAMAAVRDLMNPLALRSNEWLADRADVAMDILLAALERNQQVPLNCAAALAVLAQSPLVRDVMIGAMLAERHRPWVPMLIQSLTKIPADQSPDLAAMLAVMAYRAGDGALAQCAVDRALRVAPEHRLAGLLLNIMEAGLSPDWLDELIGSVDPARSLLDAGGDDGENGDHTDDDWWGHEFN